MPTNNQGVSYIPFVPYTTPQLSQNPYNAATINTSASTVVNTTTKASAADAVTSLTDNTRISFRQVSGPTYDYVKAILRVNNGISEQVLRRNNNLQYYNIENLLDASSKGISAKDAYEESGMKFGSYKSSIPVYSNTFKYKYSNLFKYK